MAASKYPISLLLSEIISQHASSEDDFITEVLGYRDLARGRNRLYPWLGQGDGFRRIILQFARVSGRGEELERAIEATREMKAKEYEASFLERCKAEADTFIPFVCARGEYGIPSQITFHALTGGRFELVQIPSEVFDLSLQEQLDTMPQHMREYAEQHHGAVPFWGKLTGFVYARLLDHFTFDREGIFIEQVDRPFRRGCSEVTLR